MLLNLTTHSSPSPYLRPPRLECLPSPRRTVIRLLPLHLLLEKPFHRRLDLRNLPVPALPRLDGITGRFMVQNLSNPTVLLRRQVGPKLQHPAFAMGDLPDCLSQRILQLDHVVVFSERKDNDEVKVRERVLPQAARCPAHDPLLDILLERVVAPLVVEHGVQGRAVGALAAGPP